MPCMPGSYDPCLLPGVGGGPGVKRLSRGEEGKYLVFQTIKLKQIFNICNSLIMFYGPKVQFRRGKRLK